MTIQDALRRAQAAQHAAADEGDIRAVYWLEGFMAALRALEKGVSSDAPHDPVLPTDIRVPDGSNSVH